MSQLSTDGMRIDLNSDLGESFGPWPMGQDAALMDSITSANVACGFHAGDPGGDAARPIALARENGVAVGAHPGFPDLVGLRPPRDEGDAGEVEDFVLYQVAALAGMAAGAGRRAAARQGARRALQHGVPRPRARRRHCEGGRRVRSIAGPVWPAGLGAAARRRGAGPARRRGSRSRIAPTSRTDRWPRARKAGQRDSRHARPWSRARADGPRAGGRRHRRHDDRAPRRHACVCTATRRDPAISRVRFAPHSKPPARRSLSAARTSDVIRSVARRLRRPGGHAVVALAFLGVAVAMTWPLGRFWHPVLPQWDDSNFNVWRLAWVAHQLKTDPLHLFDTNVFYPATNTLAFSDAMLLLGVSAAPLIWLGVHPFIVHNIAVIASFWLAAYFGYRLCHRLTGETAPSILGGIIFGFAPYRYGHIAHLELLWTVFMPLGLWALIDLIRAAVRSGWPTARPLFRPADAVQRLLRRLLLDVSQRRGGRPARGSPPRPLRAEQLATTVKAFGAAGVAAAILLLPYFAEVLRGAAGDRRRPVEEITRYSACRATTCASRATTRC